MTDDGTWTNTCACGWQVSGTQDEVVEATIEHGRRIHNMAATRADVIAAMTMADAEEEASESRAG